MGRRGDVIKALEIGPDSRASEVDLEDCIIEGTALIEDQELTSIRVRGCTFQKPLVISRAIVNGTVELSDCRFEAGVHIVDTVVGRGLDMSGSTASAPPRDGGALWVDPDDVMLRSPEGLTEVCERARSHAALRIDRSSISGDSSLESVCAHGPITLFRSTFNGLLALNRVVSKSGGIIVRDTDLGGPAKLDYADFSVLVIDQTRVRDFLSIWNVSGSVALRDIELFGRVVLSGHADEIDQPTCRPVVIVGLDASRLELSHLDLTNCSMRWVRNLTNFEVESGTLAWEPASPRQRGHRRRVLFDEVATGACNDGRVYTSPDGFEWQSPSTAHIEIMYRSIRVGLEQRRNERLANDFHYGEMEARRRAAPGWSERAMLRLYRGVSGYGIRPLLCLLWLIALMAVSTFLLLASPQLMTGAGRSMTAGSASVQECPAGEGRQLGPAVSLAIRAAIPLADVDETCLSEAGKLMVTVEKLIGVALCGLLIFAMRTRLRR